MGKLNANEFALAKELGMTVRRLRSEMPAAEFAQWLGYYRYVDGRRKQARAKAEAERNVKRGKRR